MVWIDIKKALMIVGRKFKGFEGGEGEEGLWINKRGFVYGILLKCF